jgi:hypothetical protein
VKLGIPRVLYSSNKTGAQILKEVLVGQNDKGKLVQKLE